MKFWNGCGFRTAYENVWRLRQFDSPDARYSPPLPEALYGIEQNGCIKLTVVTDRDFRQIGQEIEQASSKLKETKDPKLRRDLLLEIRRLLREADRLLLNKSE